MAESQTEPTFMKFLRVTIKLLPRGLSDELLQTVPIKSIESKKVKISLKMVRIYLPRLVSWIVKCFFNVFLTPFVLFRRLF